MADERQNDQEYDDLLADFHTAKAKKAARQPASPSGEKASAARPVHTDGDIPRRPDGTPYSIGELRQIQASRQAMRNRQHTPGPSHAGSSRPTPAADNLSPRQSGQDPHRIGEKARQSAAYEAAYRQQNPGQKKPVYRHRKPDKPNGALVLFALLIVVIAGISIGQMIRNRSEAQPETETADSRVETISGEETAETEETDPEDMVLWNTIQVSNDQIDEGALILVNYQYPYDNADTIAVQDVYSHKNSCYQVSNTSISLTQTTLDAMNAMTEAFYNETGSNDMIIVSGYRNVQSQRDIYNDRVASQGEELAALYVATPGYSEHHTGLAMDLSFYTDEGASVSIENYEHGSWIDANCADYGFVLRYPSDKVDITKIGYEFWRYRYVGLPHAEIMTAKQLCLEEYVEYIKQYTTDTKLLWVQENGLLADVSSTALPGEGTLVYYVPMTEGETTDIRVPRGNIFQNTEISGNNADGFIVTVRIGS